jgi:hypothetical protein
MDDLNTMLENMAPAWVARAEDLESQARKLDAAGDDRRYAHMGEPLLSQFKAENARKAEALEEEAVELRARAKTAMDTGMLLISRKSRAGMAMDSDPTMRSVFTAASKLGRIKYLEDVEASAR